MNKTIYTLFILIGIDITNAFVIEEKYINPFDSVKKRHLNNTYLLLTPFLCDIYSVQLNNSGFLRGTSGTVMVGGIRRS